MRRREIPIGRIQGNVEATVLVRIRYAMLRYRLCASATGFDSRAARSAQITGKARKVLSSYFFLGSGFRGWLISVGLNRRGDLT